MGEHVYRDFWALHIVKFLQINFDKRNQRFAKVPKWHKNILSPAFFSACLFFYTDTVYYLVTKSLFTDVEFIYSFEVSGLLICACYYYWFVQRCSPKVVKFLENLETLNAELFESFKVIGRNWIVRGAIFLVNWLMIVLLMMFPLEIYVHYTKPELKVYTLQTILVPFPLNTVFYSLISACLLLDQTSTLNEIIIKFANRQCQAVPESRCNLCRNIKSKKAHLQKMCQQHQLRYLIGIYTIIVNLCHELNRINNLTMIPIFAAVLFQSPGCLIVVVYSVLSSNFAGENTKIVFAYLLTVTCILACYCIDLIFDLLTAEIENVAKNIHKVYLIFPVKRQLNSTIFASSVYSLGTKPKFEVGDIFKIRCQTLLVLLNSLISMAVLIMHIL